MVGSVAFFLPLHTTRQASSTRVVVKFIPEEAGPLPRGKGTVSDVTAAAALARPDLPDTLQVGVNIYSDSQPGLQVRYENIRVESVTGETDCTLDS